jgi:hypothetical protein
LAGKNTRGFHRVQRRLYREVAGEFVGGGNVAPLDAGPGADPFIGRIDDLLEIEVRQHPLGQVSPRACDSRVLHLP